VGGLQPIIQLEGEGGETGGSVEKGEWEEKKKNKLGLL
jgi:hypothetical protein